MNIAVEEPANSTVALPVAPDAEIPPPLHPAALCVRLYDGDDAIPSLNLNALQLTLLILCVAFLGFMLIRLPASIRKLRRTHLVARKLYYIFLWVISIINVGRLLLGWLLWNDGNYSVETAVLWILTTNIILCVEVSVLVFTLSANPRESAKRLIKRVLLISFAASGVVIFIQSMLVFVVGVKVYNFQADSMTFWIPVHGIKLIMYIVLVSLPCLCCKNVPKIKGFYFYAGLMLLIHLFHVLGDVFIIINHTEIGFCFVDIGIILYMAIFSPMVYAAFLFQFFHKKEESTLIQEIEYDYIH